MRWLGNFWHIFVRYYCLPNVSCLTSTADKFLRPICCRELYSNGEYVPASFNGIFYHNHWSDNLNVLSAAFMHQLILTKVGVPHPYVDPAPEKVGGQLTPWTQWLRGPCIGQKVLSDIRGPTLKVKRDAKEHCSNRRK